MKKHLIDTDNTTNTAPPEDKWKDRSVESVYETEIFPHLTEIEAIRKECKKAILIGGGSGFLALASFVLMNAPSLVAYENAFAGLGLLGLGVFGFLATRRSQHIKP